MGHRNGIYSFAVFFWLAAFGFLGFSARGRAASATYYVNNQPGSNCSDGGAHSLSQPWCSFAPVNRIRVLSPGDAVLLARGGTWGQGLALAGSGTASAPITLGAYGSGADPKILLNQASSDVCVLLSDASHWNISDLEVGHAGVGILLHFSQLFNQGISINNVFAHDNKGIWSGYSTDYPVAGKTRDPAATSLNINLSAGILFNLSPSLQFSSEQYVLRGVQISNIRGSNNVDSVSFDAETSTTDNYDGHNAFQDVTLNSLVLSNDNGHAAHAYQEAGLGCSDALRLLGMSNVTVLNSVLFEEAGCYTGTGTAAVILGRVSNVKFVNNIIFGVPGSGSPDETGIDFEWSEAHVDLQANLFASNAGAAVEILNIHRHDHSVDLNFNDNTFFGNASLRNPGAASLWEDNYGTGYATPSGSVQNNFYSEPNGKFLDGKSVASMTGYNNLAIPSSPSYAAEQFSSTQGANQWHAMFQPAASAWADLPIYSPADYNGAWEVSPNQYVNAFNLAPASCAGSCDSGGVARVWVAPRPGNISIRGRVLKSDARGGSGVLAAIDLVSGRSVTRIWPTGGGSQLVAGTDQTGYSTDVDGVAVATGDQIRFEIHANGTNDYDTVSWTPSVGYLPGTLPPCEVTQSPGGRPTGEAVFIRRGRVCTK